MNINKNSLNEVIEILKKILKLSYVLLMIFGAYIILRIIKELGIIVIVLRLLKIVSPLFIGIVLA